MGTVAIETEAKPDTEKKHDIAANSKEIDSSILSMARMGDARACEALVVHYQQRVFALLSRMLYASGRGNLVEDLAQECFLRVLSNLQGFLLDGPARLSTWILTIASRLAIDELRRRQPLPMSQSDSPSSRQIESGEEVRGILRSDLEKAMERLDPERRAIFLLRACHGFTHREIAESLGISTGAVKVRVTRIRAELREMLSEVPDGSTE
jgi:RNA polymerase sigma-70 factor, ECF subfamily